MFLFIQEIHRALIIYPVQCSTLICSFYTKYLLRNPCYRLPKDRLIFITTFLYYRSRELPITICKPRPRDPFLAIFYSNINSTGTLGSWSLSSLSIRLQALFISVLLLGLHDLTFLYCLQTPFAILYARRSCYRDFI